MSTEEAKTVHNYIIEHNLLNEVEARTKAKWKNMGSRTSYYVGMSKAQNGAMTSLVEGLMILEAHALMVEHSKNALQVQEAA